MLQFERFDTAGWPGSRRVQLWNAWASRSITRLRVRPTGSAPFNARLTSAAIGDVAFVEALSTPVRVNHLDGASSPAAASGYLLHLQRSGRSVNRQFGRETVLEPGDFVLCDAAAPCELDLGADNAMLVLKLPRAALQRRMPGADMVLNRHMAGNQGAASIASALIVKLWEQGQAGLAADDCRAIADMASDLVAMALLEAGAERMGRTSAARLQLLIRIRRHIDARLADPGLTPPAIAAQFRISTRYLHKIFLGSGHSVSGYVLAQRLARCRAALGNPLQASRGVAAIAHDWGFTDSGHFTRAFREAYGVLPSDYRRGCARRALSAV